MTAPVLQTSGYAGTFIEQRLMKINILHPYGLF